MVDQPRSDESPATKLGVALWDYQSSIDRFASVRARIEAPGDDDSVCTLAWIALCSAEIVAKGSYLAGRWSQCAEWCPKTAEATIYYLLGDWKEKERTIDGVIDPDAWFEKSRVMIG